MTVFIVLIFYAAIVSAEILPNNILLPLTDIDIDDDGVGQTKVSGGIESIAYSNPYQVAILQQVQNGVSYCGGSLISNNYVLTAAHCIHGPHDTVTVVLGAHNLYNVSDGIRVKANEAIVHPRWNLQYVLNDIALIKLPFPIMFTEHIQSIDLPPSGALYESFAGQLSTVAGWGKTSENDPISPSPTLREVSLQVMDNRECYKYFSEYLVNSHICTSGNGGKGSCRGDSGGPLTTVYNNKIIQIGIVSFGTQKGCEIGYPSVYTRVTNFVDWIRANTEM